MLRSPAAGGLFVLLIIAMAAWGVTDVFSGGLGDKLVGAGNRTISDQEFDNLVERQLRSATDDRGRAISKEQALEQGTIDQLFSNMQFEVLLRAYADKVGITATQNSIQNEITAIPAFRDTTDVFDPSRLTAYLRQEGFSQRTFEDRLEAELTMGRLQQIPGAGLNTPSVLSRIEAAYNGELRSASWFVLSKSELPPLEAPTDEDLQTLYEQNQSAIRVPERRQVSMIQLSPNDYLARAVVSEADIEGYYQAYKRERYTGPDTRTFTEFRFTDEATARAALGAIAGGASASDLDGLSGSEVRSGQAGSIANERLSEQVFAARSQPASLHGPILVGSYWTVIRLESISPGEETPLETVREAISNELAMGQAVGFFYEALPRFDDLIGTGADLEDIGTDLGTPILTFAPVDQRGVSETGTFYQPMLDAEGLLTSIFNRPEGSVTERVGTDEVTYIARVDKILPERMPTLEEVRGDLAEAWTQREGFRQLQSAADEIEARLASGETVLTQEAGDYNTVVQALPRPILRTSQSAELPSQLVASLFNARREGDTVAEPISPTEILIMQVTQIDRPTPETVTLLASSAAPDVGQQLTQDLFQAFLIDVQEEIEVEVNAGAFESYKAR
ncbi:MAG: SurA N-terminal domain-containing protein, partial [Pseudomonadota bacterium]